jgi:hypothetical protein
MIQYPHKDYSWYVAVQRKLTARKTHHGETPLSWIDERGMCGVDVLLHLYGKDIHRIVCHGCRSGLEVDILQKLNPSAEVWGTDLYGIAFKYDRARFREMDFDHVPEEWKGYFDAVYSNSIDHSRDPIATLLAWGEELKPGGICFVNFHWGRGVSREDCFHLDPDNYLAEIMEIAKKVEMDVLHISSPRLFADGASCADVIMRRE